MLLDIPEDGNGKDNGKNGPTNKSRRYKRTNCRFICALNLPRKRAAPASPITHAQFESKLLTSNLVCVASIVKRRSLSLSGLALPRK